MKLQLDSGLQKVFDELLHTREETIKIGGGEAHSRREQEAAPCNPV